MKHIFRGHNQEADRVANLGADGMEKVIVEGGDIKEQWKTVRGFGAEAKKKKRPAGVDL